MSRNSVNREPVPLFPPEIIEETGQHHFWKHSVRSQLLYSTVLLSLVALLAGSSFLQVDVSASGHGVVRPQSEIKKLVSPVSGRLERLEVRENVTVPKGRLVAKIASPVLNERVRYNRARQKRITQYVSDLTLLAGIDSATVFDTAMLPETEVFRQALTAFQRELHSLAIEIHNAEQRYQRQRYLNDREMLSEAELEESEFAVKSAVGQYRLRFDRQISEWEAELLNYRQEAEELRAEELQLTEEQRQYEIYMPLQGTIQNLAGVSEGSYLQVNQLLAEISPDTGLVAECYIEPRQIGLLREGMEVHFQVDAFDYNRWGILTGKVIEISDDAVMSDDRPLFRVRASLDRPYLELKNGYRGRLKKGMTLQARFLVTRRSLFQLLYDNVDDWLNPRWDDGSDLAGVGMDS